MQLSPVRPEQKTKKTAQTASIRPELHALSNIFGRADFHFHLNRLVGLVYDFSL